ncbi:uncharacterized protein LOC113514833 [Galleria mellonella]|uniref:Uncharacterized protein LOC113514833 n=1 Tax=Galleria mellonella TaxID=7137 RepID=A0ABM3MG44_GALME|nr:uncharacterized protein LOC113514833 [Galleria mellonella]
MFNWVLFTFFTITELIGLNRKFKIMDEFSVILMKLDVPTNTLSSDIIQEILTLARKYSTHPNSHEHVWDKITKLLWTHLHVGLVKFDDQLLCATCFYAVLALMERQDYLQEINSLIINRLHLRERNCKNNLRSSLVVSLMYGMFQSSFVTYKRTGSIEIIENVFQTTFDLLMSMAYEYSKYTFLVFKTINSFKKVLGTDMEKYMYNESNLIRLLNLVNHNWENPITGVRDLNKGIFQTLIRILNDDLYHLIAQEIGNFYWSKAKYLMLSEIIVKYKGDITAAFVVNNWRNGLINSLHKPGLVSAGADMYFAILNQLIAEDQWCKIFLCDILEILTGSIPKAIENFSNYWCIATLKKFPSLLKVILDGLDQYQDLEKKLYGSLHLLKQANKLSLVTKNWNTVEFKTTEFMVLHGIEHCNPYVRMLAFEIVCISHSKLLPKQFEYDLILKYIHNNINSDSTVLRLSMLSSLKSFLTWLHTIFINIHKSEQNSNMKYLLNFFTNIQQFIINSLNFNGNYQRKISSIKICQIVLSCLSELPKKKQQQVKPSYRTMLQLLKDEGKWMLHGQDFILKLLTLLRDPADDVRENVLQLLLYHYNEEIKGPRLWSSLVDDAQTAMRSKFFYQISCSQSMFKLIANILLKERENEKTIGTNFKTVEDIFFFAYNDLITEYSLKTSIVKSIENGKQLHSLISILYVVLDVCVSKTHPIAVPYNNILQLLETLEGISNHFAWEQQALTSSDFSKMNDMVQNMITSSGYDPLDAVDHTKISGLHQIVLNCLWLNVKACCDLASLLIRFNEKDIGICEKCLKIIIHVLETSRHKGAIEAAGAALGRAIQYLTSLPEEAEVARLPHSLLRCKLAELISEAGAKSSVTRRGAGLSIMVHRIVSSDMKKGKPLFHYFMETLLEICNNLEDVPTTENEETDIDNQRDLPKAIYVHFLTRVVTDSSLASDMMHYSAKLAELAFSNLTSAYWQIRNAALQLYGALIPKLIGQKKASGSEDETVSTVACDEFRTHSPNLWTHIEQSLQHCNKPDLVLAHSNLVPILNVLANIARRYNFAYDSESRKEADESLLTNLVSLLGSPLYIVRRLSAKCIYNIYPFENVYTVVINQEYTSENVLHGNLILLTYYKTDCSKQTYFVNLKRKFSIIMDDRHSYLCRQLFEDLFTSDNLQLKDIRETLLEVANNSHKPGASSWANRRVEKYIETMDWNGVTETLEIIQEQADCEYYCKIILHKIKNNYDISKDKGILLTIAHMLLVFRKKFTISTIWKILYEISLKIEFTAFNEIKEIIEHIRINGVPYKLRYMLPFVARMSRTIEAHSLLYLSKIIYSLSDPETTDVDMRYIATLANNELANSFNTLSDIVKINSIKSAVTLLQDEDEDIRCLCASFYRNIKKEKVILQPYIVLQKIVTREFLQSIFVTPENSIQTLVQDLLVTSLDSKCKGCDEYNPFTNDSKNIYMEVDVLLELIEKLKKDAL